MPRNSSGVYTLPAGNPVVPGTVIDAAWANDTLEDLANEVTNSLSRTGAGGMLAPFRIADGNVTAPGISYLTETNSGLYRSGAGSVWMSVLGVNTFQFSTVGVTIPAGKALTAVGNASVGGTLSVGGATTLASTLAVTGAITATGGVLGNITATSGTSTFNNVTINGNLDMDAGSSGTITNLPNPVNPGDAANKAYVDSQDALRLALTGGTMTGAIAMSNNKVTGLATPTADQDAATKAYVDSIAQGIDAKASCRAATTANITLSGNQTIDGVAVIAGDRVLVKNQSSAAENGIYVAAVSTWSRAADANTWDELVAAYTFIESGTDNGSNGYICTIAPGGTLGTTPVTWAQFSGAGQINAGTGMSKTGNTLNVNTASSSRIVVGADEIDLATTGVTASTYKSVTVDQWGRVTAGTNPTTLAGFGIGDAYTQTQTDTLLAAKLSTTGGTMSGSIAMGTNKITGLGDPTLAQDAATKNYIDTIFGSTTTAAASAAAAAASASAASSSATSASGSASSASASAAAAAASYDSFDDRYLGPKASDPTVDNDGNALLTGALYWNTTSNQMRVYNGSAWEVAYLPASGYAALASANVFTANQTINANTSSAALSITQVGSGNALYIEDVAADATPFVVSSTGAVGIGTTTPDNVTSAGIALVSNDGYYPQVVNRNKTNDATASYLVFDKDRAGAVVQSGDNLGNIVFRSFDGANYLQSAAIIGYSDGTPGTNDVPGRLSFLTTADGASAPTERLRISNTGALGMSGANYGTAGQVLTSGGSGAAPTWSTVSGAQALTINSNTTATSGNQYLIDTSLNTVTLTLPASPTTGNTVAIYDANNMFGNNALTINPNGSTLAFRSGNVVVNQSGRNIFLRYNGTTWVSEAIPGNGLPQLNSQATTYSITGGLTPQTALGFGAGLFVALTWNSYAITSPDGITWTQRNLPSVKNWSSVAYGNGRFVAVSGYTSFSTSAAYSTDGINWTASTCELGKWIAVAYGNGLFCSVRSDATSSAQTSTDGVTWSAVTLAASTNWADIVYGNGVFVAKSDGSSGNTIFNTSSNGSSWTSSGALGFNAGCIAYGNGIFVALNGAGGNASYVSGDGLTWQVFTANLPATGSYNKLVFHNNTFFGFRSSSSSYIYSYDGRTWMTGSLSNTVTGMAAAGNGVIATVSGLASTGNQLRIV